MAKKSSPSPFRAELFRTAMVLALSATLGLVVNRFSSQSLAIFQSDTDDTADTGNDGNDAAQVVAAPANPVPQVPVTPPPPVRKAAPRDTLPTFEAPPVAKATPKVRAKPTYHPPVTETEESQPKFESQPAPEVSQNFEAAPPIENQPAYRAPQESTQAFNQQPAYTPPQPLSIAPIAPVQQQEVPPAPVVDTAPAYRAPAPYVAPPRPMAYAQRGKVSLNELLHATSDPNQQVRIMDVRGEGAFNSGHIPNAISAPLENILKMRQMIDGMVQGSTLIAVMCDSDQCSKAESAQEIMVKLGYKNVRVLKGGWEGYKHSGQPIEGSR